MQKQHVFFAGGSVGRGDGDGDGLGELRGSGAAKLRGHVAQTSPIMIDERMRAFMALESNTFLPIR